MFRALRVLGLPLQFCALAGRRPRTATEPERTRLESKSALLGGSRGESACFGPRSGPPVAVLRACRPTAQNGNGRARTTKSAFFPWRIGVFAGRRPRTATGEPERGSRAPNQHFWAAPVANLRVSRSGPPGAVLRACRPTAQNGNGRARTRLESTKSALLGGSRGESASFWASRCSFARLPVDARSCCFCRRGAAQARAADLNRLLEPLRRGLPGLRGGPQRQRRPCPVTVSRACGRRPRTAMGEPEQGSRAINQLPWRICVFRASFWASRHFYWLCSPWASPGGASRRRVVRDGAELTCTAGTLIFVTARNCQVNNLEAEVNVESIC